jgi:maltokinase
MELQPADAPLEAHIAPDDGVLEILRAWVPAQRWFPAKGEHVALERVGVADLPDPLGEATVQVHLLALPSGRLLQVPTVVRVGAVPDGTPGVIGVLGGSGVSTVVDGPHDPAFVRAWLSAATKDLPVEFDVDQLRVLTGEQSNTSVILAAGRPPAILKVFRGLTTGANPDVEVPLALSHAGWHGVPRPLAWLTGTWPGGDEKRASGHLGVLTELVTGAHDGFRLACDMAAAGTEFGTLAEDLGRTTAQLHRALRLALPVHEHLPRTPANRVAEVRMVTSTLRERATDAARRVPALAERLDAALDVYAELDRLEVVAPLQRVHGDYHLGQVLRSADDRWYVLDFEGEPQASATEKTRPDLALRDVAGMLRSLDYAASVGSAGPGWATSARLSLVAGYHAEAGSDPDDPATVVLLRALELDKALYEVVYESGNRPDWVPIPLSAVDRLIGY